MKNINDIKVLKLTANALGKESVIYPVVLTDKNKVILVDGGYPGQLESFKNELLNFSINIDDIDSIILTHQDIDHIGSVKDIVADAKDKKISVYSSEFEKDYIEGTKVPHKVEKFKSMSTFSEDMNKFYQMFSSLFSKAFVKVDKTLKDGEIIDVCGGTEVIYTGGHTVGHICLYIKNSKTLIVGDMLTVEDGELKKCREDINYDTNASNEALKKLLNYDIETIIAYHGGVYSNKVNERLKELVK